MINRKDLSIVIPIQTSTGVYTIYIPDLPKERVDSALPVLGHLYSEQERLGYNSAVLVQDYEYYARQASQIHALRWAKDKKEVDSIAEKIFQDFSNFVVAAFTAATVITPDYKTEQFPAVVNKLSENERQKAEGYFSFFYAVLRYALTALSESELEGWTSSLSVSEYAKRLMTSSSSAATSSKTPRASSRRR